MSSSFDLLANKQKNRTAKLDGPMTCGYGIDAIDVARKNRRCSTNICFSLNGLRGLCGNKNVAIKKRCDLIEGLWGTTLVPLDVAEITAASLLLPTA